jgi:hypothetical protein
VYEKGSAQEEESQQIEETFQNVTPLTTIHQLVWEDGLAAINPPIEAAEGYSAFKTIVNVPRRQVSIVHDHVKI